MGKRFERLDDSHRRFIAEQHLYFVATAAPEGRVNLSPKGMDSLRVLGPNRILWLNLTGSGNETAGHLLESPRMTLMWCAFTARPMILRAFGTARTIRPDDAEWAELAAQFPPQRGARQIFDLAVDLVQSSCGYAVPFMDFRGDRDTLRHWTEDKSDAELRAYWRERNAETIDGKPTGPG